MMLPKPFKVDAFWDHFRKFPHEAASKVKLRIIEDVSLKGKISLRYKILYFN